MESRFLSFGNPMLHARSSAPRPAPLRARLALAMLLPLLLMVTPCRAASPPSGSDGRQASDAGGKRMSVFQALVLGAVEGLTEYLPVSSTGHLLLAERIMAIGTSGERKGEETDEKEAADAYAICIQAGAIVAVLGLYRRRVAGMIRGLLGKDPEGLRMVMNILAGFVPAAVIGLLLNKAIKAHLFGIWPVIAAWFVGGVAILLFSRRKTRHGHGNRRRGKDLRDLTWRMAIFIGFAQCIAMWPGVSRSLITIVGGLAVGLSLSAAVEFSFLLGVVTLGAATVYDAYKHGSLMLHTFDPLSLGIGLVAAFVFAVISVKWMVSYLNRHDLTVFGVYRIAVAVVTAALVLLRLV